MEMTGQVFDAIEHAISLQNPAEVSLDNEGCQRRHEIQESPAAEQDQPHREPPRLGDLVHVGQGLPITHRGDGDAGHVDAVQPAPEPASDDPIAGGAKKDDRF